MRVLEVTCVNWIGQDAKTCQDYINAEGSRSRYGNIGTAFKSSNAKVEAILKPTAGLKLYDVYVNSKYGMIKALLENGTNTEALDYIVVTTGFEQNLRQLFTTFSDNQSQKFPTDTDYFKADFTAIRGKTATVSNETNLGLKLKDRNVYVLGTAAGNIVPKEELVGIIQNSVSIFNNAPRVVAATEQITRELYRKASGNQVFAQKIMPVSKEARLGFLVTDIQESRFIPNQTLVFLQSSFREALTFVRPSSLEKIVISVSLAKDGNLLVTSKTDLDVRPLVELLASSREFFSLSRELLKFTPKQSLILIAEASANGYNISQAQAQLIKADKSEPPQTQVVKNGQFKLRGLNREISDNQDASKIANKNREEAEQKKREEEKERQKALDISANLINSAKKMIFNEILPGKFNMTDAVTRVTITKPFALAQTQTTQLQWSVIQILLGKTDPKEINPSYFKTEDEAKLIEYSGIKVQLKPDHPVEQVSYNDITAWIAGLNKLSQEGNDQIQSEIQKVIPGHKKGDVYDLPTEAQWAFVMQNRGKNNEAYFDRLIPDELDQYAWYGGEKFTSTQTHAVATKKPRKIDSGDGKIVDFYDLEGNVWEIMNNRFSGRPEGGVDPIGPSSTQVKLLRLTRGGAWNYVAKKGSVNVRSIISSDYADYSHGFRLLKKVNDPVSDRVSDRSPLRKFFDLLFSPGG